MRKVLYVIILLLPLTQLLSQTVNRVEVNGKIYAQNNDLENVTIYNSSSNKGTITNVNGEFTIKVTLNDVLEISALQFKKGSIKITEEVLSNMYMKISLVENVTELQEVVLLPYDLTGNLVVDTENINLVEPIPFELGNMDHFELPDDYHSKVVNPFMNNGELMYGLNGMAVLGLLFDTIFKSSNKPKKKNKDEENNKIYDKRLEDTLGRTYIANNFNISEEKLEAFLAFIENKGINPDLLLDKNRMQLIEFLHQQSALFLKS